MSVLTETHRFPLPGSFSRESSVGQSRHVFYAAQRPAHTRQVSSNARPKTSSGIVTRNRSELRPIVTGVAKSKFGDIVQELGATIDIQAGLETFKFPTPSPRQPTCGVTFPDPPSPKQTNQPQIGRAIGSPSDLLCADAIIESLNKAAVQHPPRMSSLHQPTSFDPAVRGRVGSEVILSKQERKSSAWKGIGGMFRKSSKAIVPSIEDPLHQQDMRKDSLMSTSSFEQPNQTNDKVTALPNFCDSPRPMSRAHSRATEALYDRSQPMNRPQPTRRAYTTPTQQDTHLDNSAVSFLPCDRTRRRAPGTKRQDSPMADSDWSSDTSGSSPMNSNNCTPEPENERLSVISRAQTMPMPKTSIWERRRSRLMSLADAYEYAEPEQQVSDHSPPKSSPSHRRVTSPTLRRMPSLTLRTNGPSETIPNMDALKTSHLALQPSHLHRSNSSPTRLVSPLSAGFQNKYSNTLNIIDDVRPSSEGDQSFLLTPSPPVSPITPLTPKHRRNSTEDLTELPSPKSIRVYLDTNTSRHSLTSPIDPDQHVLEISIAKQVTVTPAWNRVPRSVNIKQPLRARVIDLGSGRKGSATSLA